MEMRRKITGRFAIHMAIMASAAATAMVATPALAQSSSGQGQPYGAASGYQPGVTTQTTTVQTPAQQGATQYSRAQAGTPVIVTTQDGRQLQGYSYQTAPQYLPPTPPGYAPPGYQGGSYAAPAYAQGPQNPYYHSRVMAYCRDKDGGLGGALTGAAAGGLAGHAIAGRGEHTEGTLIGAGVGALAGYAIDMSTKECNDYVERYGNAPGYQAGAYPGYAAAPQGYYPPGYEPQRARAYDERTRTLAYCKEEHGIGGALLGAALGAAAGYAIAGRGDRTEGALIGGGVGGLAGYAIDMSENECRDYVRQQERYDYPAYQTTQPGYGYGYQSYYPGQYGWYIPPATVTTVTVQSRAVESSSYEYEYETEPATKHKYRRRAVSGKRRCTSC